MTNGLGGYASGTVAGPNTRRYHGLLVAALRPPVQRVVLLAELHASIIGLDGEPEWLGNPSEMELDGTVPSFRWQLAGRVIERRIWMEQGHNRTVIGYQLLSGAPATLRLEPFLAHRPADLHRSQRGAADVRRMADGWEVSLDGMTTYLEARPGASVSDAPVWLAVEHPAERERALDHEEDLFSPGMLEHVIQTESALAIVAGTNPLPVAWSGTDSLAAARRFQQETLDALAGGENDAMTRQLALAASQFRVIRASQGEGKQSAQRSIIAGYPWFADWGRDTMIALRGVTLAAGYPDQARQILKTFIGYLDQGVLPNAFHDPGEATEFNTIDATLWLFQALHHYLEATGDWA
ncbi:MAG TPA: glycogen debranching enzyme N-terminal domain-containing protein, partial [Vicinamibacterales bacterium]|nr:glycogen debranching enzyme N-terminal domain-containing protein [Vicinamibacterales bacterium]